MKQLTTSIILAAGNLVFLGLVFLGKWTHVGCCSLGSPASVVGLVIVPFLVLASVAFAARDLFLPRARWQAVLALILSVPIGVMYFVMKF